MEINKTKIGYIFLWQSTRESDATILLPYAKIGKEFLKMYTWIFSLSRGSSDLPKLERKGAYIYTHDYNIFICASTFQNEKHTY